MRAEHYICKPMLYSVALLDGKYGNVSLRSCWSYAQKKSLTIDTKGFGHATIAHDYSHGQDNAIEKKDRIPYPQGGT